MPAKGLEMHALEKTQQMLERTDDRNCLLLYEMPAARCSACLAGGNKRHLVYTTSSPITAFFPYDAYMHVLLTALAVQIHCSQAS